MSGPFEEIQSDPDVCSNCFRRTHGRYERNYRLEVVQRENEEGKLKWTVEPVNVSGVEITFPDGSTETIGGMDDDVFKHPDATMKIPEKGALNGLRTVCKCGMRYCPPELLDEGEDWKLRPLPKRIFFEYAEFLEKRMEEAGVSFDSETYYDTLDALKSDPDEQFADDRIFKKACKQASSVQSIRDNA